MKIVIVLAAFAAALVGYVLWVRPYLHKRPEFHQFYDLADGFWGRLGAWLKIRWDMTVAALAIIAPEIPDLLTQLQAVDLGPQDRRDRQRGRARLRGVNGDG